MCGQWRSPYAVAMQDGAPFALAGIWENWKERASGDVRRTPVMLADAGWTVSGPHWSGWPPAVFGVSAWRPK